MNTHARQVISRFVSRPNMLMLYKDLVKIFSGNPKVTVFLNQHFAGLVSRFARTIEQEMLLSDPMAGATVSDMIWAFNTQFMRDRVHYIRSHVLGDEQVPEYSVTDGLPTSRFGLEHHSKSADDILATWNMNANHPVQARDDQQASRYYDQNCRPRPSDYYYNPYQGRGDNHIVSGISFCDQSALNTQQHVSQLLDNSSIVALNRETGYTNDAFGNATPASDARLLSRRVFRSNEHGVENGVRMGEARLQRRNFDRDIDETLPDAERDGLNRGYDMQSLYDRVRHKQTARAFYQPRCNERFPKEFIYNAHTEVDPIVRC